MLAVDGPAPLARLITQRERRKVGVENRVNDFEMLSDIRPALTKPLCLLWMGLPPWQSSSHSVSDERWVGVIYIIICGS